MAGAALAGRWRSGGVKVRNTRVTDADVLAVACYVAVVDPSFRGAARS